MAEWILWDATESVVCFEHIGRPIGSLVCLSTRYTIHTHAFWPIADALELDKKIPRKAFSRECVDLFFLGLYRFPPKFLLGRHEYGGTRRKNTVHRYPTALVTSSSSVGWLSVRITLTMHKAVWPLYMSPPPPLTQALKGDLKVMLNWQPIGSLQRMQPECWLVRPGRPGSLSVCLSFLFFLFMKRQWIHFWTRDVGYQTCNTRVDRRSRSPNSLWTWLN